MAILYKLMALKSTINSLLSDVAGTKCSFKGDGNAPKAIATSTNIYITYKNAETITNVYWNFDLPSYCTYVHPTCIYLLY